MGVELGMREWMLLAGIALVLVILLDAIRRAFKQRAENERLMRAKKSERQEPHADFGWLKELPNGGARVVYRDDGVEETDDPYSFETSNSQDHGDATPESTEPSADRSNVDAGPAEPKVSANEAGGGDVEVSHAVEAIKEQTTSDSKTSERLANAETGQTVDWLESLDTEDEIVDGPQSLIDESPPDHVLLIHLKAEDHKPYRGDNLLQLLLACDLRFGDLGFFHRHEHSGGRGPIQFSVANLLKPGVFDIDSMSTLETAGIVFFMRVPGPKDLLTAYDAMLETAKTVVQHLGGTLLDHSHSVLTKQAIEHDKTLLREYARKQLLQKRS
jgi:cell division protein ZipA